uniref:Uncharacterized protein n=1 Tax=Arundo donax TaxID=35708 RepID=A0A0A9GU86_ARUDO
MKPHRHTVTIKDLTNIVLCCLKEHQPMFISLDLTISIRLCPTVSPQTSH